MKKILLIICALIITSGLFAQAPEKMSYQAVVRNASDDLVTNITVGMKISILQGSASGTVVFSEEHSPATNDNGLVTLEIGDGALLEGDFSAIDWADGPFFIKTETDPEGGSNYTITGVTQLLSVPYALYSNVAGKIDGTITDKDPVFLEAEEGDLITYDGTNWVAKSALVENAGGSQPQNNMQPWLGIYYIIALQGVFPSRNAAEPLLAEIIMFGGNFAPRGWAFCDGQLLPINQNQALFSLLGTTYGGDGRTTFGLPDLRGRVPVHPGTGPGLSQRRLGEKGGTETNTMNINQMPEHSHNIIYE